MKAIISPSRCGGAVTIPPSKSLAHRAIICAALAAGKSTVSNVAFSQDITATLNAIKQLGAKVQATDDTLTITGVGGLAGLQAGSLGGQTVDCCESGSTLRFLIPLLALGSSEEYPLHFSGQGRLLERPQTVYQQLFARQGIAFQHTPLGITVAGALQPGSFTINGGISSQFITGLLLTLPLLAADSTLSLTPPVESCSYINLTIDILSNFGITIGWQDETTLYIPGGQSYRPASYRVEGDCSQLAFWAVLGALNQGINCLDVNLNSRQGDSVILDILQRFGADVTPISGGCRISPAPLSGQPIDLADCPDLGPILTVLACFSQGQTVIGNAGRLRLKESDRIAAMEQELTQLGFSVASTQNEIIIQGCNSLPPAQAALRVEAHNDHRIAMSLAVLGCCYSSPIIINRAEAINKSYPTFYDDLRKVNGKVVLQHA